MIEAGPPCLAARAKSMFTLSTAPSLVRGRGRVRVSGRVRVRVRVSLLLRRGELGLVARRRRAYRRLRDCVSE